jgi:phenylalanyl-tRNA synthetase beta chain
MKFSENWLRSLVDIPADRAGLAERLTMAGLEVEAIEAIEALPDGVVVAEIIACDVHPDADRLRVCRVAAGATQSTIVCGAPNARAGLKAPLAKPGTRLPNGSVIKTASLRGVESAGMLCSAAELGLQSASAGLLELPDDAVVGAPVSEMLGLPDASLELKLTPNRPDCLGMTGLARDVAAVFGSERRAETDAAVHAGIDAHRGIRHEAGADCPRYLGRVVSGIDPHARTPLWLCERLRRSGLRPVGPVVDVTNYVMLETGQPLHAFDDATLEGDITVRRAAAGETLTLLDGAEAVLDPEFLVIADARRALAVAGIMGGQDSRVTSESTRVFLESAHFAPAAIMGRARRLGLHTDASHRFERGVDAELPRHAIERATRLLLAIAGGEAGPVGEALASQHLPARAPIRLRRARLERLLGITVADAEVERILAALGLGLVRNEAGWTATPPSWRFDLAIEEDLIEEVVRIHGLDRVPARAPRGSLRGPELPEAVVSPIALSAQLVARDYCEALCFSFLSRQTLEAWQLATGAVALANPLSAELGVMRTSLLPGLVAALAANRRRQQERVRLFEMGRVFHLEGAEPVESVHLAGVACGLAAAEQWAHADRRTVDFFDLKGDVESLLRLTGSAADFVFAPADRPWLHPGQSAGLIRGAEAAGWLGALHPDLLHALDLDTDVMVFELVLDVVTRRAVPHARPLSRYPSVRRDIAVVVPDEVSWSSIEACVRGAVGPVLVDLRLFDRYRGPNLGTGIKSLAMGLILQDASRTLTDQDADQCVALAVAALESGCKARLRG